MRHFCSLILWESFLLSKIFRISSNSSPTFPLCSLWLNSSEFKSSLCCVFPKRLLVESILAAFYMKWRGRFCAVTSFTLLKKKNSFSLRCSPETGVPRAKPLLNQVMWHSRKLRSSIVPAAAYIRLHMLQLRGLVENKLRNKTDAIECTLYI